MTCINMRKASILLALLLLMFGDTAVGYKSWNAGAMNRKSSRRSASITAQTRPTIPVIASNTQTISQYLDAESWKRPDIKGMADVILCIDGACRDIKHLTRRVLMDNLGGLHQGEQGQVVVNVQGETQRSLDVVANKIMRNAVCSSGNVAAFLSEEEDLPCLCPSAISTSDGSLREYTVVFDPLDGSSNIESGLPMGTIFGIYRNTPAEATTDAAALCSRKGEDLVAAGYCLYAAATHFVLTLRQGVHLFTLDDQTGQFHLSRSNMQLPSTGPICAFNTAYSGTWDTGITRFISDMHSNNLPGVNVESPKLRYVGALVADAHNVLMHGGVFGYPATATRPQGKLRQLYEANPLALLMEEAGGVAVGGAGRVLEAPVHSLHQRTPLYFGSRDMLSALQQNYLPAKEVGL
jgi:fructose-1,6-bisphosphatase I